MVGNRDEGRGKGGRERGEEERGEGPERMGKWAGGWGDSGCHSFVVGFGLSMGKYNTKQLKSIRLLILDIDNTVSNKDALAHWARSLFLRELSSENYPPPPLLQILKLCMCTYANTLPFIGVASLTWAIL